MSSVKDQNHQRTNIKAEHLHSIAIASKPVSSSVTPLVTCFMVPSHRFWVGCVTCLTWWWRDRIQEKVFPGNVGAAHWLCTSIHSDKIGWQLIDYGAIIHTFAWPYADSIDRGSMAKSPPLPLDNWQNSRRGCTSIRHQYRIRKLLANAFNTVPCVLSFGAATYAYFVFTLITTSKKW